VSAPAEIPHADEALRDLFERFKRDPGAPVFGDLSEALLVRGHANEALRIAEHGLSINPVDVEGRVHRAASLLALAKPKVAYVELRRALAIAPKHRKALRLLGRVYVEAGQPERAAALLRDRHRSAIAVPDTPRSVQTRPGTEPVRSPRATPPALPKRPAEDSGDLEQDTLALTFPPPGRTEPAGRKSPGRADPRAGSGIPELFASLTHDLGLGPLPDDFAGAERRVEVTQVVRARLRPRQGEALTSIDGPIVDTTQPGDLDAEFGHGADATPAPSRKPSSLFDVVTSPEFHITYDEAPSLDEVLAVRPVPGIRDEAETINDEHTVDEQLPSKLELDLLRRALEDAPPTESSQAPANAAAAAAALSSLEGEDTSQAELPAPDLPYLRRFKRPSAGPSLASVPPLELVRPRPSARSVVLAVVTAALLVGYLAALAHLGAEPIGHWLQRPGADGAAAPALETAP
jgi:hypothetical protein